MNLSDELKPEFERYMQACHDREVWEALEGDVRKWQSGTLHVEVTEGVAKRLGLTLEAPAFLDRLLEVLAEVEPEKP